MQLQLNNSEVYKTLVTPRSGLLLENLTVVQPIERFPECMEQEI